MKKMVSTRVPGQLCRTLPGRRQPDEQLQGNGAIADTAAPGHAECPQTQAAADLGELRQLQQQPQEHVK